jgi:hypothetical protein
MAIIIPQKIPKSRFSEVISPIVEIADICRISCQLTSKMLPRKEEGSTG